MYLVPGGRLVHLPCVHRPAGAMAAEALLPLCSPPVRQLYHTASPLNGSRWLMIPVTDEAVLTDVKELIGIRAAA